MINMFIFFRLRPRLLTGEFSLLRSRTSKLQAKSRNLLPLNLFPYTSPGLWSTLSCQERGLGVRFILAFFPNVKLVLRKIFKSCFQHKNQGACCLDDKKVKSKAKPAMRSIGTMPTNNPSHL